MRLLSMTLLVGVLIPTMGCGSGKSPVPPQSGTVSGNWQITLSGNDSSTVGFSGFLSQSGGSVTGSLLLESGSSCSGVGSVLGTATGQNDSGTVNGENVSLNINQSGGIVGLTGTAAGPSATGTAAAGPSASMSGNFTSQPGVCSSIPASGTWSAVQITPIAGSFHGTFTFLGGIPAVTVAGTLNQGPNTGGSTATLSGTLNVTGGTTFCSYVLPGTITGLISGSAVQLNLYGENGSQYAQLGNVQLGSFLNGGTVNVTPDGTSLSGDYSFPASNSCEGVTGSFQLSFP